MRARRLQMGCNIIEWNVETRQIRNPGDTSQTHFHGCRKIRQQTRRGNYAEQVVEAKNYWHWIHQRTGHHHHNRGQPPTHQTDECVLPPLGACVPSHRENVQNDPDAHSKLQKMHTHCWMRLQCRTGTRSRNRMHTYWLVHTQRGKQKRWLDETLVVVTKLHSTRHDVQKDTSETNGLHISKR